MRQAIKDRICQRLNQALESARAAGELVGPDFPQAGLERPKDKGHGDWATNLALILAKPERKAPRAVAGVILRHLNLEGTWVSQTEIAGPGFINLHLDPAWLGESTRWILVQGEAYGRSEAGRSESGRGQKVIVEFVSANPTGPMVLVQARSGAVGDTLCNLFDAAGYEVWREFYVNDAGNQIRVLGRTLEVRIRQQLGEALELPEEAYHGEYVTDLARRYLELFGLEAVTAQLAGPEEARYDRFGQWAAEQNRSSQERVLLEYGVRFDRWFSERSLRQSGEPEKVVSQLTSRGHTYEQEGAVWFRSTAFGDDKDRVLRKSDGEYTYVVPDIAYHQNKFARGFTQVIDILGPDHHGYVARMRAALQALGYPAENFEVIISQQVRLLKGGEPVSMSKRAGQFITLEDLLKEVGRDAARFFFLMRSPDSHLDFDLDLARTQTNENPVFYVQYAHARICSLMRQEGAESLAASLTGSGAENAGAENAGINFSRLTDPSEIDLMDYLSLLPGEIASAAASREPQRMTRYALDLAGLFHAFYTRCRVLSDDTELSRSRLALCSATRTALKNILRLLGVSAPERM